MQTLKVIEQLTGVDKIIIERESFFEADKIRVKKTLYDNYMKQLKEQDTKKHDKMEALREKDVFFETHTGLADTEHLLPCSYTKETDTECGMLHIHTGVFFEAELITNISVGVTLHKFVMFSRGFLINTNGKTIDKF